jgi:hypothetical protein
VSSFIYNLPEVYMAKKVLKFPKENTARLRLMAHFAEDRNECVGNDTIRDMPQSHRKIPPRRSRIKGKFL